MTVDEIAHNWELIADDDLRAFFHWDGGDMSTAFDAERRYDYARGMREGKR